MSTEDKPEKYRCVVYFVRQCIFPATYQRLISVLFTSLNWRFGAGFERFTGDSQVFELP